MVGGLLLGSPLPLSASSESNINLSNSLRWSFFSSKSLFDFLMTFTCFPSNCPFASQISGSISPWEFFLTDCPSSNQMFSEFWSQNPFHGFPMSQFWLMRIASLVFGILSKIEVTLEFFESDPVTLSSDLDLITVWWYFIIFKKFGIDQNFSLIWWCNIRFVLICTKLTPDVEFLVTVYEIWTFLNDLISF